MLEQLARLLDDVRVFVAFGLDAASKLSELEASVQIHSACCFDEPLKHSRRSFVIVVDVRHGGAGSGAVVEARRARGEKGNVSLCRRRLKFAPHLRRTAGVALACDKLCNGRRTWGRSEDLKH